MYFPLGKPIAAMLLIAAVTSTAMFSRDAEERGDLVIWTFSESHTKMLCGPKRREPDPESPLARYSRESNQSIIMRLVGGRALDTRLLSLFNDPAQRNDLPDLVFVEIGSVGKFFRPPVDHVGFLPLNERLKNSGWYDRIVQTRFAPWSKNGVIFGVPIDLHPVAMLYRKDLWDEAGIDLEPVRTWREFHQAAIRFRDYWQQHNEPNRSAMALQSIGADDLTMMLLQRGVNLIEQDNSVHFDHPLVLDTLRFYSSMTVGKDKVSADFTPGVPGNVGDLLRGDVAAAFCADWFVNYLKSYGPELKGKLRLRPLPVFEDSDSRCATWGGTMAAIPRDVRDPDASWKLLEALLLNEKSWPFHRRFNAILPPIKDEWKDEFFNRPDPFFHDSQPVQAMYVSLAGKIPRRCVTPFTTYATGRLAAVVAECRDYDGAVPEETARKSLAEAQTDVQRRIAFSTFEEK